MSSNAEDLTAAVKGRAQIFIFNHRRVMAWPADICERYGIDESVAFDIVPDDGGFKLVLRRKGGSLH